MKNFHGEPIDLKQLSFIFLFCPNNSGTTILSQYIASQIEVYLPPFGNNEGQMIPEVKPIMRNHPWNPHQKFDWPFIRSTWEKRAAGKLFFEASPPNLMRPQEIEEFFGHDSTALISISNPYQYISSCLRRYRQPGAPVAPLAREWLMKAKRIRDIRKRYPFFPFLSYEDFVTNPRQINRLLGVAERDIKLQGKAGSEIQGLFSGFPRAIGFLHAGEIGHIRTVLAKEAELIEDFGYGLLSAPQAQAEAKAISTEEFRKGCASRESWEPAGSA